MTSDAKIGLLLGLVFIFIIAFVINGFPRFRTAPDNNDLTLSQDFIQPEPLGANIRNAAGVFNESVAKDNDVLPLPPDEDNGPEVVDYQTPAWSNNHSYSQNNHAQQDYYTPDYYTQDSSLEQSSDYIPSDSETETQDNVAVSQENGTQEDIRDNRPFPFNTSKSEDFQVAQLSSNTQEQQKLTLAGQGGRWGNRPFGQNMQGQWPNRGMKVQPQPLMPQGQQKQDNPVSQDQSTQKNQQNQKKESDKTTKLKTYVIEEGDNNLAKIAKKFYGEEEGNRIVNVKLLFETNKDVLKSPDQIFVGQTIVIPEPAPKEEQKSPATVLNGPMFQKVPMINNGNTKKATPETQSNVKWYEVKENESLWKIAFEQLGKGTRFNEISKLNADILTNENKLKPGMKIRLPEK